mmetsp:Transcript_33344/g.83781  ORF Transcript_33344/g.83781 Transcript_33344/m.83781 type:complete len:214 (+) Transcript_33344:1201-1842(+)
MKIHRDTCGHHLLFENRSKLFGQVVRVHQFHGTFGSIRNRTEVLHSTVRSLDADHRDAHTMLGGTFTELIVELLGSLLLCVGDEILERAHTNISHTISADHHTASRAARGHTDASHQRRSQRGRASFFQRKDTLSETFGRFRNRSIEWIISTDHPAGISVLKFGASHSHTLLNTVAYDTDVTIEGDQCNTQIGRLLLKCVQLRCDGRLHALQA